MKAWMQYAAQFRERFKKMRILYSAVNLARNAVSCWPLLRENVVQNLLMPHMIDLSWMNAMKTESIFEKTPGLNMPSLILLAARLGMGIRQEQS